MLRETLTTLREEFRGVQTELERARGVHAETVDVLRAMKELVGPNPTESDAQAFFDLWPSLIGTRMDIPQGVLTSLLSSGSIRAIRSSTLRAKLIGWSARLQDLLTSELIASDVRLLLRQRASDRTPIPPGGRVLNYESAFPHQHQAVLSDVAFENQVARLVFLTENVVRENEALSLEADVIVTELALFLDAR